MTLLVERLELRDAPGSLDPLLGVLNALPVGEMARGAPRVAQPPIPQALQCWVSDVYVAWNATLTEWTYSSLWAHRNAEVQDTGAAFASLWLRTGVEEYTQLGDEQVIADPTGAVRFTVPSIPTPHFGEYLLACAYDFPVRTDYLVFSIHQALPNRYDLRDGPHGTEKALSHTNTMSLFTQVEATNGFGSVQGTASLRAYIFNYAKNDYYALGSSSPLQHQQSRIHQYFVPLISRAHEYLRNNQVYILWEAKEVFPTQGGGTVVRGVFA